MEFVNRETNNKGRVKIIHSDNTEEICKIQMYDNPTVAGTPLNAENFTAFKKDILNSVANVVSKPTFKLEQGVLYITLD